MSKVLLERLRGRWFVSRGTRAPVWDEATRWLGALAALGLCMGQAQAQTQQLSKPYVAGYSSVRTSGFAYDPAKGVLTKEIIEPEAAKADLCVQTSYLYDSYGNKTTVTTQNCTGASAAAQFDLRSGTTNSLSLTAGGLTQDPGVLSGVFPITQSNALNQSEYRTFDPKTGQVLSLKGPNGLITTWELDGFGRKITETHADGSKTRMWYCLLDPLAVTAVADFAGNTKVDGVGDCASIASGLSGAGTPGLVAHSSGLSHYIHTQSYLSSGAVAGPYVRTYYDLRGREVRSVTQGFDGGSGATSGKFIAKDTYYLASGATAAVTQPYFWDTGRSVVNSDAADPGYGYSYTEYDVLGRPVTVYTTSALASNSSDLVDMPSTRPAGLPARKATRVTYSYDGLNASATVYMNGAARTTLTEKNPEGKVVRITDALGAQLVYQYDDQGNLRRTFDAMGANGGSAYADANVTVIDYDARGRKVAMSDPNKGNWSYAYNALGELVSQTNAKQQVTKLSYDKLGRPLTADAPDHFSKNFYDVASGGGTCSGLATSIGLLCGTTTQRTGASLAGVITKAYKFDGLLRPLGSTTVAYSGAAAVERRFELSVAYDSNGRVQSQTYPTGLTEVLNYTALGFINKVGDGTGATISTARWVAGTVNAWGKSESYTLGNSVYQRNRFDPQTGAMLQAGAGTSASDNVFHHDYSWDTLGNLVKRTDAFGSNGSVTQDVFGYDALNRLTSYQVTAPPTTMRSVTVSYNAVGNILNRSDVGYYEYAPSGSANPHAAYAVRGTVNSDYYYDGAGNMLTASAGSYQAITYNSFNQPDGTAGILGRNGTRYTFVYDDARQRFLERRTLSNGTLRSTYKLHPDNANGLSFEQEREGSTVTNRHYVSVGGLTIGMLTTSGEIYAAGQEATGTPQASAKTLTKSEYWHQDQLGSIVALTDWQGTVRARYAYDPWGQRRNADGTFNNLSAGDYPNGTDRGFTGHEHFDDIGLIHMNGRMYDPVLARFLQADPVVGDAFDMQTFNGYSYVYNRPLVLSDANGQCPMCIALALIVAARATGIIDQKTFKSLLSVWVAVALGPAGWGPALGLEGAGGAAVAGFASGAISSGSLKGGVQGMFTAMAFYGVGSMADGLNFGASPGSSTDAMWGNSGFGRAALHAVVGCASSSVSGGSCKDGASGAAAGVLFSQGVNTGRPAIDLISHAVIGGTVSYLGGGKFSNGAMTSSYGYMFNYILHLDMGNRAHATLQEYLEARGVRNETSLWDQTSGTYVGRADLTAGALVWEIKPANPAGTIAGDEQLARYTNNTGYTRGGDLPGFPINGELYIKGADNNTYHYVNLNQGLVGYEIIKGPSSWETMVDNIKDFGTNLNNVLSKMLLPPPCGCNRPPRGGGGMADPAW